MKRTRAKPRRAVHPVQPAHRLQDGSVKAAEYEVLADLRDGALSSANDPLPVPISLRKLAEGRPCMVRLPGCDGGGATTVLAHYRMTPYCGIGAKPNDFVFGAWCCAHCHDAADFRVRSTLSRIEVAYAHMQGILRTQMALIELGLVNL